MKTILKVAGGIVIGGLILIIGFGLLMGGCAAVLSSSVDEAVEETKPSSISNIKPSTENSEKEQIGIWLKDEFVPQIQFNKNGDEFGYEITSGEITNTSDFKFESIYVSFAVQKDGKTVADCDDLAYSFDSFMPGDVQTQSSYSESDFDNIRINSIIVTTEDSYYEYTM